MKEKKARKKRSIIFKLGKEKLQNLFDTHKTYADIMKAIGYTSFSDNYKTLHSAVLYFSIDLNNFKIKNTEHIKNNLSLTSFNNLTYLELIGTAKTRQSIKRYIITKNLIPYVCSECGNDGNYNDKPLILQLDHIDGNPINNVLENLRFLCPNCHSQTDTFAGKKPSKLLNCEGCGKIINVKNKHGMCQKCYFDSELFSNKISSGEYKRHKKFEVSKEDLEKLIEEYPFTKIGEMFGVSDKAIRNRCISLGIDISNRKFSKKS